MKFVPNKFAGNGGVGATRCLVTGRGDTDPDGGACACRFLPLPRLEPKLHNLIFILER